MLPKHLLSKIRLGAGGATLLVALGTGKAWAEETAKPEMVRVDKPTELTREQLDLIKATIPKLGEVEFKDRERASAALIAVGPLVVPELKKALPDQKDAEIKSRLTAIIKKFTEPEVVKEVILNQDPCPACGRG